MHLNISREKTVIYILDIYYYISDLYITVTHPVSIVASGKKCMTTAGLPVHRIRDWNPDEHITMVWCGAVWCDACDWYAPYPQPGAYFHVGVQSLYSETFVSKSKTQ